MLDTRLIILLKPRFGGVEIGIGIGFCMAMCVCVSEWVSDDSMLLLAACGFKRARVALETLLYRLGGCDRDWSLRMRDARI